MQWRPLRKVPAMTEEHLSQRGRIVFAATGIAALLAAVAVMAVASARPGGREHRFTAVFASAGQGLDPGRSEVKVRGIAVGRVESVRLRRDGRVVVGFRVDGAVPVRTAARAAIEPVSIFGPKDLALDPGTGPPLADGGRITRTAGPEELTDVAGPAYDLTRAIDPDDVATLLHSLSSGLDGEGPALRRTVLNGAELVDAIHARRPEIARLISDITGVSGTLGDRGATIAGMAADYNRLAPSLYARPDRVSRLLDETSRLAERTSGALRRQGTGLGRMIDATGDVAGVIGPLHRNMPVLMDVLHGFFHGLGGLFRIEGPEGTVLATGLDYLSVNPCDTFIDLCELP